MKLSVTPWKESSGHCDCCGRVSKTVWGDISAAEKILAVYYVQWTVEVPEHYPNIDLIIGAWGKGVDPKQRVLVSLLFRPQGGSFMVTDSENRPANNPDICGRALKRLEVIGTPLANDVFQFVDAIWLQDPRVIEIRELERHA